MKSTILIAIVLALGPASFAFGQFALDSLPKPGQWAEYESKATVSGVQVQPRPWSRVIRCLPDSSNRVPACIWIELEIDNTDGGSTIYKLLVPQTEFRAGGDALSHLVEGWKAIKTRTERAGPAQPPRETLHAIPISDRDLKGLNEIQFVSPPDDAEQLMSDYFDVNGETARCQGIGFSTRLDEKGTEHIRQFENYLSPDTPFGLVAANLTHTIKHKGKKSTASTVTTVLVASGDNAVSALPDIK